MGRSGIRFLDRRTGQICEEKVFAGKLINFLYGERMGSSALATALARLPIVSKAVGWWYRQPFTARLVAPFIEKYAIESKEFLVDPKDYDSFDAFFTRKLKPDVRPIASADAIMPADGRYWFFPDGETPEKLPIKGLRYALSDLLGDRTIAESFKGGAIAVARLCPSDYHRFHFPVAGVPGVPKKISGNLYSVNPTALRKRPSILWENQREVTLIEKTPFGTVAMCEVGATCVGTIHQTFSSETFHRR